MPGDVISCDFDSQNVCYHLYRNGEMVDESYIKSDMLSIEDLTKIQQEIQTIKNSLQLDEQVLIEQDIQEIQILITNKGE